MHTTKFFRTSIMEKELHAHSHTTHACIAHILRLSALNAIHYYLFKHKFQCNECTLNEWPFPFHIESRNSDTFIENCPVYLMFNIHRTQQRMRQFGFFLFSLVLPFLLFLLPVCCFLRAWQMSFFAVVLVFSPSFFLSTRIGLSFFFGKMLKR